MSAHSAVICLIIFSPIHDVQTKALPLMLMKHVQPTGVNSPCRWNVPEKGGLKISATPRGTNSPNHC